MTETEPDAESSSHVVIDVEAAAAAQHDDHEPVAATSSSSSSSCAVCMEPMAWVAVSRCGHRDVCCVRCAARIRFIHNDCRCCICRSHCPTVVVTKATTATTQREPDGSFPFLWPPPPPAPAVFGGQGLVVAGVSYWYHRGMGAYFDDVSQYQEMSKVCTTTPGSTGLEEPGGAGARAAAGGVNQ